jgi:hypothetical protein
MGKAPISAHIQIVGAREMQAALKKAEGKLPKALGEAHKEIGRFIIGKIGAGDPHAVGEGSGANVRPSATKRAVVLRVGHGKRSRHGDQWGRTPVQPFRSGRPYLIGALEENEQEIRNEYARQITKYLKPYFADTRTEG